MGERRFACKFMLVTANKNRTKMKIAELKGRQRGVVQMILKGYTREQMIAKLGISTASVTNAKRHAFENLGITSELQLLALAVRDARREVFERLRAESNDKTARRALEPLGFIDEVLP